MKKRIFIFIIGLVLFGMPLLNVGATTLKEYEDAVAKYTKELEDKESKIAKNDKEVAEIKARISDIENQIKVAHDEVDRLQREIEESNKKIEEKNEESKKLIKYLQVVSNENSYLEYIFGSTSIQEMVYRVSVVEQLMDYNKQLMEDLQKLIDENNKKKQDLNKKQEELNALQKSLEEQKSRIEADTASIRVTMPSTKDQIKMYKDQVNYWKNKGCKSNDVLGVTCGVPPKSSGGKGNVIEGAPIGPNGFRFPVANGRITGGYGGHNGHLGIDIGKGFGAPIYAIYDGQVIAKYYDNAGALVIKIVHNVNGKLVFSTYAHMQSFAVNKYQMVTNNTIIGYMGSTGNSTGPHLHLEISEDYDWTYNMSGKNVYARYINHIVNPWKYIPS